MRLFSKHLVAEKFNIEVDRTCLFLSPTGVYCSRAERRRATGLEHLLYHNFMLGSSAQHHKSKGIFTAWISLLSVYL